MKDIHSNIDVSSSRLFEKWDKFSLFKFCPILPPSLWKDTHIAWHKKYTLSEKIRIDVELLISLSFRMKIISDFE